MDVRTTYQFTAGVLFSVMSFLLFIHLSTPRLKGLRWITIGYFCNALGMELMAFPEQIPGWLPMLFAHLLLLLTNVCVYRGLSLLLAARSNLRFAMLATLAPVLLLAPFYPTRLNAPASQALIYAIVAIVQYALLLLLVLRNGPPRTRAPRVGLAVLFALWAGSHLDRIALTLRHTSASLPAQVAASSDSLGLIIPVITGVLSSLGLVWLALAELQSETEQQSHTDPLTGLVNRRGFNLFAAREIAQARRQNTPLALLICDLDHFKAVNDEFGHDGGDAALKAVAGAILSSLRTNDLVARVGGEEFVIVLPMTDQAGALQVGERILHRISSTSLVHHERLITLSASLGLTHLNVLDRDWEDLLHRADKALYQAKQQGRNRIILFDPPARSSSRLGRSA